MQDHKKLPPTKLLWVDLEMTGLDATQDVILEIAAEITDFNFTKLASYETRVQQDATVVQARMQQNPWWQEYPQNRDDFMQKLHEGKTLAQTEQELVALVEKHFGEEPVVLAGNSIRADRSFIKQWWPQLEAKLHYRMLDVSSLKVYMQGRYGLGYQKREVHRAYDDIQESIAEWQYYMDWLKQNNA